MAAFCISTALSFLLVISNNLDVSVTTCHHRFNSPPGSLLEDRLHRLEGSINGPQTAPNPILSPCRTHQNSIKTHTQNPCATSATLSSTPPQLCRIRPCFKRTSHWSGSRGQPSNITTFSNLHLCNVNKISEFSRLCFWLYSPSLPLSLSVAFC